MVTGMLEADILESFSSSLWEDISPDSKVHGANMGSIWGRQDPGGPHGGPVNYVIQVCSVLLETLIMPAVFDNFRKSQHNIVFHGPWRDMSVSIEPSTASARLLFKLKLE